MSLTLQEAPNRDYLKIFKDINLEESNFDKEEIGRLIPYDDSNGELKLKYVRRLTPIQIKKIVSFSVICLGIITTTGVVLAAVFIPNYYIFLGLIPTVTGTVVGVGLTIYYFYQIDLQSPKQRKKETLFLRDRNYSLSALNERYGSFAPVIGYGLLGEAPLSTYRAADYCCRQQAVIDSTYDYELRQLKQLYDNALEPARYRLRNAEMLETTAATAAFTSHREDRFMSSLTYGMAAQNSGYARAEYDQAEQKYKPYFNGALFNLERARVLVAQSLTERFLKLPLSSVDEDSSEEEEIVPEVRSFGPPISPQYYVELPASAPPAENS